MNEQMSGQGLLTIIRDKSFVGCAINIKITIDNYPYELSNGQVLSFNLVPGRHVITYKCIWRRMKTIEINVMPNKNYSLMFVYDWLWGGFKLASNSVLQ